MTGRVVGASLEGDLLVVRQMTARLERAATHVVFRTSPGSRDAVLTCLMEKLARCLQDLRDCARTDKDPGQGPNCPPGSHEYAGRCVPDDPEG